MEQSGDPADSVSYVPGDSLPTNPLSTAELREMCRGFHRRFSTVPAGNALSKLAVRERTLASLDAATGLRVNELLALGWGDVNLENLERRVTRSIWHSGPGQLQGGSLRQTCAHGQPHGRGSSPLAPSEYLRIG